jgi:hypothetical protein
MSSVRRRRRGKAFKPWRFVLCQTSTVFKRCFTLAHIHTQHQTAGHHSQQHPNEGDEWMRGGPIRGWFVTELDEEQRENGWNGLNEENAGDGRV